MSALDDRPESRRHKRCFASCFVVIDEYEVIEGSEKHQNCPLCTVVVVGMPTETGGKKRPANVELLFQVRGSRAVIIVGVLWRLHVQKSCAATRPQRMC